MKRGFSIAELMIVVAIIGILAAIVVPHFQGRATEAKTAAAKSNLRILRSAIELYAAQHSSVPPGYPNNDPTKPPDSTSFLLQMTITNRYLSKMARNPFNNIETIQMIGNAGQFPSEATGAFGWVYKPATNEIRLDWPGTDKDSIRYYDY